MKWFIHNIINTGSTGTETLYSVVLYLPTTAYGW